MMVIMLALVLLCIPFFLLGGPCKDIFFYIWRPLVRPSFFTWLPLVRHCFYCRSFVRLFFLLVGLLVTKLLQTRLRRAAKVSP